jgi:hypothetical protein
MIPNKQFKLMGEPLYGGKGKHSGLIYNHCDIVPTVHDHVEGQPRPGEMNGTPLTGNPGTGPYAGLNQLLLASDSVVLREDKMQMRHKNKHQWQALRAKQTLISPWTRYQGMMETLDPTDHANCPPQSKFHVPNRACNSTPRCQLAARMGHIWVPHNNWQALVKDQNVGGSRQGSTFIGTLVRGNRPFCCQSCGEGTKEPVTLGAMGFH